MTHTPHSTTAIDATLQCGDAALVIYLLAGFPSVEGSIRVGRVPADRGVDVIELGFPYSDPGIGGPTIQRTTTAALERGTHLEDLSHAADRLVSHGISICSVTYWNPVEWWGIERFAKDFTTVGGSGLVMPDLPLKEGAQWEAASDKYDLERIYLSAPPSPEHHLKFTAEYSHGWVYTVPSMGVTDACAAVGAHAVDVAEGTRATGAERVCMGLDVSSGTQVHKTGAHVDGVTVGSAPVKTLFNENIDRGLKTLDEFITELKFDVTRVRT